MVSKNYVEQRLHRIRGGGLFRRYVEPPERKWLPAWRRGGGTSWPRGCMMKPNPLISLEISWSASDLKGARGA